MARILLLTPQIPYPPHQGTTIRNFNIIRGVSSRHDLALLSYWSKEKPDVEQAVKVLGEYCFNIQIRPQLPRSYLRRLFQLVSSATPDMANRLRSQDFDDAIVNIMKAEKKKNGQPFDIIQIEGIEMASAIPIIREADSTIKIIFDNHNAEFSLQKRAYKTDRSQPRRWPLAAYSFIQTRRLQKYEKWACESVDHMVAVSENDLQNIKQLAPHIRASVIPNSLDVEEYLDMATRSTINFDLVFIGKMDYRPNVDAVLWFAENVWPEICSHRSHTTWAVVGQNPHSRLDALRNLSGVTITGKVDSIHPYLAGASVVILPFRIGSGTRLKFIEAMASGKATVSTSLGAEGFDVNSGDEVIIADEPRRFTEAIISLMRDPERRIQLGQNAQAFARSYDYRLVNKKFDAIYDELTITQQ
jgi:glycosyltransferase involved in cell wall biosynthesis